MSLKFWLFWLRLFGSMIIFFSLNTWLHSISERRQNFEVELESYLQNSGQNSYSHNIIGNVYFGVVNVNQLNSSVNNGERLKPFKILFWTTWYGSTNPNKVFDNMSRPCEDFQTIISFNKKDYPLADVVMFQVNDLKHMPSLPSWRNPSVPWILCLQETPSSLSWPYGDKFDGIFNYTWSHREESEINLVINDMLEPRQAPDEDWKFGSEFSKKFLRTKTKMAAWIVSNSLHVQSKRTEFAKKLQHFGVKVTVFNNDHTRTISNLFPWRRCPRSEACFRKVGLEYKSYFAFENSLCANSISEKVARGIVYGMVPVFYGIYNLSSNAPPHSYIDAMQFNSTKELAEYLIFLDRNDEEYFKYFEWRQKYSIKSNESFDRLFHCPIWRKIKKVKEGNQGNIYDDLEGWFIKFRKDEDGKGSYCDLCLEKSDIDENNPRATKDKLYSDKNCKS